LQFAINPVVENMHSNGTDDDEDKRSSASWQVQFEVKFNSHLLFTAYYRPMAHYKVTETMVSRVEN